MRIEILKAGTGDCIWISLNKKNIVIDGGKSTTAIKERYSQMPQNENIDLLVVSHIDSDHIAGIIALVKLMKELGETHRLKQVWFNFPKKVNSDEFSILEGNELSSSLCDIDDLCWINNTSKLIDKTIEVGDIKLHVLAPDHDVAYEYKPQKPDEYGLEKADWNVNLQTLIDNADDDNLDEGGPNSQSIVILVEHEGKKVLLPGDCTPLELFEALHSYNSRNGTLMELDLMKLPHHGSTRNFTKGISSEIVCSNFVISTKANKNYLFPNKETIAKLICYRNRNDETVNVFFNYHDALGVLGITEREQSDNNINLTVRHEFNF